MNARLNPPTLLMTLVRSQRFQRLPGFSPQSTRLGWKPPYADTRPVARRARKACDLAAARAEGTGAGLQRPAPTSTHGAVSEGRGGYSIALGTGFADPADPSQAYGVRR